MNKRRRALCAGPLLLFLIDISLTLWGQPPSYWAGDYTSAIETSPEVRRVMQIHPAMLFLMIAVWMGVIVLLVQLLPRLFAELFSVVTTIAHTVGASSWLNRHFSYSYQLKIGLSIAAACLVVMSLRAGREIPVETASKSGPGVLIIIVSLLIVIAYAVLYPH